MASAEIVARIQTEENAHEIETLIQTEKNTLPEMETILPEDEENLVLKKCQLFLLLSDHKKKIYNRLMLNEEVSEDIMFEVMGWNEAHNIVMRREGKIPVREMMVNLCRKSCEECPYICVSPLEHYQRGSCAPIGVLKEIFEHHIPGIMDYIFMPQIRDSILKSVQLKTNHESLNRFVFTAQQSDMVIYRLPNQKTLLSRYFSKKYDRKSMNVLLVDCLDLESDSKYDKNIVTKALNLFENIEENFSLFVAPQQGESRPFFVWSDFVEKQIKLNAECVIMVVTPKFAEHFKYSPDRKNDAHRERLRQAIRFSHTSKKPIFAVVFRREDIQTAMEISPFVYELPDQMKFLLLSVSQIIQSMRNLGDQNSETKKVKRLNDSQLEDDDGFETPSAFPILRANFPTGSDPSGHVNPTFQTHSVVPIETSEPSIVPEDQRLIEPAV